MGASEGAPQTSAAAVRSVRRRRAALAGVALLLLLGAVGWALVGRGTAVQVVAVQKRDIVQSVVATGRVNAAARLAVASELAALVQSVPVREGQRVRAGQLLVQLADAEPRAALAQAQAALAEAQARARQQVQVGAAMAEQALLQAAAARRAAEREHARTEKLVAQGFFPPQRLDEARRSRDVARSAWASAQVQLQAQRPQGVEPQLAQARVQQAEAAVRLARAHLARLALRAPVAAQVLRRDAEPGLMASPGRELLALAAGPLRIDASIDERHLPLLRLGMPARAVADAFAAQAFDARLEEVSPAVDPERGSVAVRLALPQPPAFLRPDMTVSVELLGGRSPQALVLPSDAVRDADRDTPWVLVLQQGRALRTPVRLGLRGVGEVQILQGLAEGALVIPPTERALPGDRVRQAPPPVGSGFEVPSYLR